MSIDSYQPNIIPTKAEIPKEQPKQYNPPAMEDSSLQDSTIIQKPSDKPINLDMNAFLGSTQKTKKDIDLINDVILNHILD